MSRWMPRPRGLNEDIIRLISAKKKEPAFMLEWRLKAYRHWAKLQQTDAEPKWANISYPPIDYQDIVYYSAPKPKKALKSLDEVDPEVRRTFEKLGIPLEEAEAVQRSGGGRGIRQRVGGDHVQGEARRAGDHLLLVLRGGAEPSGFGAEVPGLGGPIHRQLLRGAERRGVQRRVVLLHPEGRPLPHGAGPRISGSTPRTPDSSSGP